MTWDWRGIGDKVFEFPLYFLSILSWESEISCLWVFFCLYAVIFLLACYLLCAFPTPLDGNNWNHCAQQQVGNCLCFRGKKSLLDLTNFRNWSNNIAWRLSKKTSHWNSKVIKTEDWFKIWPKLLYLGVLKVTINQTHTKYITF